MLVELVTRDGPAQWADKARQLGSGRSDSSVRSQWVDGLRYSEAGRAAEGLAADRELLQPTQQQSSGAGSLVSRGPPRVLVIAGPTGVGKSALAEQLCRSLEDGGEIISADSVQVYRRLDLGSAKPTAAEQRKTRYHLIDIADPQVGLGRLVALRYCPPTLYWMYSENRYLFF